METRVVLALKDLKAVMVLMVTEEMRYMLAHLYQLNIHQ